MGSGEWGTSKGRCEESAEENIGQAVRELANSCISQTLHSPTVCHFKVLFAFLLKRLQLGLNGLPDK
ncbi:hypothetical protein QQF64_027431 [Cirrhinus molitorella]|uniref:Uncharacterized protein n=1 Tax=Cirrhinus molitorella TaxID=172907 RepID=A0ABR3NCY8_9TELE